MERQMVPPPCHSWAWPGALVCIHPFSTHHCHPFSSILPQWLHPHSLTCTIDSRWFTGMSLTYNIYVSTVEWPHAGRTAMFSVLSTLMLTLLALTRKQKLRRNRLLTLALVQLLTRRENTRTALTFLVSRYVKRTIYSWYWLSWY